MSDKILLVGINYDAEGTIRSTIPVSLKNGWNKIEVTTC